MREVGDRCGKWEIGAVSGRSVREVEDRCGKWEIGAVNGRSVREVGDRCGKWEIGAGSGRSGTIVSFCTTYANVTRYMRIAGRI